MYSLYIPGVEPQSNLLMLDNKTAYRQVKALVSFCDTFGESSAKNVSKSSRNKIGHAKNPNRSSIHNIHDRVIHICIYKSKYIIIYIYLVQKSPTPQSFWEVELVFLYCILLNMVVSLEVDPTLASA